MAKLEAIRAADRRHDAIRGPSLAAVIEERDGAVAREQRHARDRIAQREHDAARARCIGELADERVIAVRDHWRDDG